MEITRAFEIVTRKVEEVLLQKDYKKQEVVQNEKEITALYTGEVAYSIVYYTEKMRMVLRTCAMDGDEPDNSWKTVATWLFDPDADTAREAENIGDDFAETIRGPKQTAVQKQKKNHKNSDNNSDPLFFANRMVTYFPELRDEIAYEKAHYASFRGITFAEEKIKPRFQDSVNRANEKFLAKMAKNIASLYDTGDLDVKGIITYILLNSLEDDRYEMLAEGFDKDMKKVTDAARKLRGKKVKPEKLKKRKNFIADTLNSM